jgi:hypothetical protein
MRFVELRILVNQLIRQLASPLNTFLSTARTCDKDLIILSRFIAKQETTSSYTKL